MSMYQGALRNFKGQSLFLSDCPYGNIEKYQKSHPEQDFRETDSFNVTIQL